MEKYKLHKLEYQFHRRNSRLFTTCILHLFCKGKDERQKAFFVLEHKKVDLYVNFNKIFFLGKNFLMITWLVFDEKVKDHGTRH